MKYILIAILAFLINLPTCGMVFSAGMDMGNHSISSEVSPLSSIGEHIGDSYDCCVSAREVFEKNTLSPLSIKTLSSKAVIIFNFSELNSTQEIQKHYKGILRSQAPPGPSEYTSLIGVSVKNLD